jgi:hypothetical protein
MQFLNEPLWFKLLISSSLVISIVFSSSTFSNDTFYQSISKLAAAIFFCAYGFKMRRNIVTASIMFAAAAICMYLAIFIEAKETVIQSFHRL